MKLKIFYGGLNTVRTFPGGNNAQNREEAIIQLGSGYIRMPGTTPPLFINTNNITHIEFYDNNELP